MRAISTLCQRRTGLIFAIATLLAIAVLFEFSTSPPTFARPNLTSPTLSSIAITSDPDDDDEVFFHDRESNLSFYDKGVYGIGDDIELTVTFSEDVTVTGSPQLKIDVGGTEKPAGYDSTDGSAVLFSYTVATGDSDTDGISVSADKLTLNGGAIKDGANNPANLSHSALTTQSGHKVDGIRPTITRAPSLVRSSFLNDEILIVGETITASVRFSEEVIAMGPHHGSIIYLSDFDPGHHIGLNIGTATRYAEFEYALPECEPEDGEDFYLCLFSLGQFDWRGNILSFRYTVQRGDLDTDGVSISASALSLNGSTIKDGAGNTAVLTHGAVAEDSAFKVDGVPATVSSIEITSDPGDDDTYGAGDIIEATVTMTEDVIVSTTYPPEITMDIGGVHKKGTFRSENAGKLVFSYRIFHGVALNDSDGISFPENSVRLSDGQTTGNYTVSDATGTSAFGSNYAELQFAAVPADSGHKVETPVQPSTSSNATLSALTLDGMNFGAFSPGTTSYSGQVAHNVSETTVSPTVSNSGASYVINLDGVADSDGIIPLSVGTNTITVQVTAEDGITTITYTVTVTRASGSTSGSPPSIPVQPSTSSNATLSALTLDGVNFGAFSPGTTSYSGQVAHNVSETTVSPTVSNSGASYVINLDGVRDSDGVIPLSVGTNTITVQVTAEDGITTITYTVTVTRASGSTSGSPPSIPEPDTTDSCSAATITADGITPGDWSSDCQSQVSNRGYARYYSFTLAQQSQVTIDLESSTDPFLYLRAGDARSGTTVAFNDDVAAGSDTDSRISETLAAGTYTIEATTYSEATTGSFTLTVSGLGASGSSDPGTGTGSGETDSCRATISGDGTTSGAWVSGCQSQVSSRGYARYYSFTLAHQSQVTIDLESSVDTYLYLRAGDARSGTTVAFNDDVTPGSDTDSQIVETLAAGTYTIEATTYSEATTGSFTLTVSGVSDSGTGDSGTQETDSGEADSCGATISGDGTTSGAWVSGCQSQVSNRGYARYYSFTLAQQSQVTIDLESSTDPFLYLRAGDAMSGTTVAFNDDVTPGSDTDSQIVETLASGAYTIEATTYNTATTGSFTLTISGLGASGSSVPGTGTGSGETDSCGATISTDGSVSGTWASGCQSQVSDRGYARYYSFTLPEQSQVTIDLESSVDTFLYLRESTATRGTAMHDNDDMDNENRNSQIVATLGPGTYTIEATTYSTGETGSFTLTVTGMSANGSSGSGADSGSQAGGGTEPSVGSGCSSLALTLPASGVSGRWADDCQSQVSGRGFARYYSFTLTESLEVAINLTSSEDAFLYLRQGNATSGSAVHENDDIESGNTDSRIVATLSAGNYTIEATTYNVDTTGIFSLSVSG